MFTKRIIPCLDVNNGRVVKGVNFVQLRDAGDPVDSFSHHQRRSFRSSAGNHYFLDWRSYRD